MIDWSGNCFGVLLLKDHNLSFAALSKESILKREKEAEEKKRKGNDCMLLSPRMLHF